MKKNFIRIISFTLALITLTLGFSACADSGVGEDTTAADVNATTSAPDGDTASGETDPLTDEWGRPYIASPTAEGTKLADGTVIKMMLRDYETWNREFFAESENGDILNDAIYKRNHKLEEDLNFTFEFIESASKDETQLTVINEYQSGGTSGLDLISNYAAYSTVAALRDCYVNLYDVKTMNVSNPWWNRNYVEAATIKDQLYFIVGDLNLTGVDRAIVFYYNTTLASNYNIGNLYDTVLDGQWTVDLLIQYSKDAWVDTNQSGVPDMADKVGILSSGGAADYDGFLTAFGIDMLAKTADGGLEIAWDPNKVSSAIDYNIALLSENNGAYADSDDNNQINKFTNDEALFWLFYIYPSAEVNAALRNMPSGYGLLPLPKYDLNQENYYTTAQNAYSTMSIMGTSKHIDEVGIVFEEWNYRSYMDILPAYCEVIMKTRYLVDVESGMVFDLIRESIKFDTGMIYGHELEKIGTFTRSIVQSGTNTFASTYKVQEKIYNNRIKQLLNDFEKRVQ